MAVSWTVVIVLPSSGTLTFRLLESEPLRCQKGTDSCWTTVSLNEVGERPIDRAVSLSEGEFVRVNPTGLLDGCEGQSWYLDAPAWDCRLTMEGLFSKERRESLESLAALRFLSDCERRGRW